MRGQPAAPRRRRDTRRREELVSRSIAYLQKPITLDMFWRMVGQVLAGLSITRNASRRSHIYRGLGAMCELDVTGPAG
jgi:hypothetical protein